jgi:hypothetical protein
VRARDRHTHSITSDKAANTGVKLRTSNTLGFVSFNSLLGGLVFLIVTLVSGQSVVY